MNFEHKESKDVLRILVDLAEKKSFTTYSELADKIDGYSAKTIKDLLYDVGDVLVKEFKVLPPITALVVHKDVNELPGKGFDKYCPGFSSVPERYKKVVFDWVRKTIYDFPNWDEVKKILGV
jgi:hypothetical protein